MSAKKATESGKNYMHYYKKLENAATTLREDTSVNIDELLPIVDEALEAYKECLSRINAVDQLLKEKLAKLE